MRLSRWRLTACATAVGTGLLVAGMQGATPQEQRYYLLTATLKPPLTAKRTGTPTDTVGHFWARLDRDYNRQGGYAVDLRLTFTGLSGPATAVHIHRGRPGGSGRELTGLCGPSTPAAPACKSPLGYFWWGAWALGPVLTAPAYIDVHTKRNPAGELRGQLRVVPLERRR